MGTNPPKLEHRRFEKFLSGFRAVSRNQLALKEDESQRARLQMGHFLDGYRTKHAEYAEAQKISADDFNLFRVTGIEKKEVVHSALLAWLFDWRVERGTHAQGNLGFQLLLEELEKELDPDRQLDVRGYADLPYRVTCEVASSKSRVDIEIAAATEKGFIIHIENKIMAAEGEHQTRREWEDLTQRRAKELGVPLSRCHAVFLTLLGDRAEDPNFIAVGWHRIALVLDEFAKRARPGIVKVFASHYAEAIRNLVATQGILEESTNAEANFQHGGDVPGSKLDRCEAS